MDSDPIMEEREDGVDSNGVQSEANNESDERSPPADAQESEQKDDSPTDTDAVSPSTVNEEEEADAKPASDDAAHPIENLAPKDVAQSMDEDLTLDADATTSHDEGCHTPAHAPAFCGCFAA